MTDVETAELEVVCPGMLAGVLEVLSIGKGDLKLTVGGGDPDEVDRARKIIEEMLAAGYAIFVETDDGPERVTAFNPNRMSYTIADGPEPDAAAAAVPEKKTRKKRTREVPVSGSRATAVGRTSGGCAQDDVEAEPDLGLCPYLARWHRVPGFDPEAICSGGCVDEPSCMTNEPDGGWPSWRALYEGNWTVEAISG